MWPGWLAWARVAGAGTAAYGSVRAGHARPLLGWLKESSRQQEGIPPALRRHLPLTREAGSGGVKTPPYEWKIQWQQTQSVRAGHARPLPGG